MWSSDGHYLASGGGDNIVKIWEPSTLTAEDPVRFSVALMLSVFCFHFIICQINNIIFKNKKIIINLASYKMEK